MAKCHIGLSGYAYRPWQGEGRFYPPDLKQKQYYEFYSERYSAVEMDGTWYRYPSESLIEGWIKQAKVGSFYSPKMHRNVTHISRLKEDCYDGAKFFLKRIRPVAEAGLLGSILIQLPPNMKVQPERLDAFLTSLPTSTGGLADPGGDAPLRYAMEFRHESWNTIDIEGILKRHGVAWVAADTDEVAAQKRATAQHVHARLRKSDYSAKELSTWADYFVNQVNDGRDCFVYLKHEDDGSPWIWADRLLELIGRP